MSGGLELSRGEYAAAYRKVTAAIDRALEERLNARPAEAVFIDVRLTALVQLRKTIVKRAAK